jgi:hypothetical protein
VFRVGAKLLSEGGLTLESSSQDEIAAKIASAFQGARTPIRVHGTRAEEMFAYAIAAVGVVRAIKREETDDLITSVSEPLTVPDFRVILSDGEDILVEVKNFHGPPDGAPRLTRKYLQSLIAYGDLFRRKVFVAIYWSRWGQWTLHNVGELLEELTTTQLALSFGEAYRRSEMRLLGDALLGTEFPLTLRFGVTSELKARRGSRSEHVIRIESVEMTVAGKPIRNSRDQRIAWGLMLNGRWEETERLEMEGDRITSIEYSHMPLGGEPQANFAPVASLSSLASREFNDLTASSKTVDRLRPQDLPSPPYPKVGERYHGVDLPLWILIIKPDQSKSRVEK